MANFAGKDLYGTFGGTPGAQQNITAPGYSVQASAADFGGDVGRSMEKVGNQIQDVTNKYAQMHTEAMVNDDFANKYAPAAVDLRTKYDSLNDKDKVAGYDSYVKGLQKLNSDFVKNAPNPSYANMMGSLMNRNVMGELNSARREMAAAGDRYAAQSSYDVIKANSAIAAQNYKDPNIVNELSTANDAQLALKYINNGHDLNDPFVAQSLESEQRNVKGDMAVTALSTAAKKGDISTAYEIRNSYSAVIPGFKQIEIDKNLYAQSLNQQKMYAVEAFKEGKPLPQSVGAPHFQVQAIVADSSQRAGLDPNIALTVAQIESSMGQNVGTGKRATLGQTVHTGGDLQQQSDDMVSNIIESKEYATKALGREPEPWETYTVYQQGAGGGPALLKAATENPTASAIEVLTPLYKNPKDARSAILNNGGDASMTANDFLKFLKQKYTDNAARAAVSMPEGMEVTQPAETGSAATTEVQNPKSLSQAIIDAHTQTGPTIQKAVSPLQQLVNFDEKSPDIIARIQAIPNDQLRAGVMAQFQKDRQQYQAAASAYSNAIISDARKMAVNPEFTSMTQIPPDMYAVAVEKPAVMNYLQKSAEENLAKKGGTSTADMKTYGKGMFSAIQRIGKGEITSEDQLLEMLPQDDGTGGEITIAGYEKLRTMLSKNPESKADAAMQAQAFKVVKRQLSGEDDMIGIKDPKGEELYSQALPILYKAIEDGQKPKSQGGLGLSMGELTDPSNPNWIGKKVESLKRTIEQQKNDMLGSDSPAGATQAPKKDAKERTYRDILIEAQGTTDRKRKAELIKEAVDRGFLKVSDNPRAPISQ